jgi:CHAD domain-containing protein
MAAKTKWIESRPDDTGQQVARRALSGRLKRMWEYLERAVEEPHETENVHQLRVFSRRAAAAMDIFHDYLPGRRGRWMHKQVKRVRKASGEARDFDVLAIDWMRRVEQAPGEDTILLLEEIHRRRRDAQAPIQAIHERLRLKRFRKRVKKLAQRTRKFAGATRCDHEFACMARVALARLATPYLAAGESELVDAEALHAFRIQGKQVRYAMEVFAGAFDDTFRQDLYPLVASLLDRLGAINDHVTARTYFAHWHGETDSCALRHALASGMAQETRAFEASKAEFLDWWTPERRNDLRRRFGQYVQLDPPPATTLDADPAHR